MSPLRPTAVRDEEEETVPHPGLENVSFLKSLKTNINRAFWKTP